MTPARNGSRTRLTRRVNRAFRFRASRVHDSVISVPGTPVAAILEFDFVRDVETRLLPVLSVLRLNDDPGTNPVVELWLKAVPSAARKSVNHKSGATDIAISVSRAYTNSITTNIPTSTSAFSISSRSAVTVTPRTIPTSLITRMRVSPRRARVDQQRLRGHSGAAARQQCGSPVCRENVVDHEAERPRLVAREAAPGSAGPQRLRSAAGAGPGSQDGIA